MLLSALIAAVALQATPAQIQRIGWVPNPRTTGGGWVADPSRHLAPATVATLNQEIAALEQATGVEIAVVVVDSTSGLTPFDFALAIHRGWGVGKSGRDNGVVFLWVPTERAVQISVGYGLEGVLPDRRTGRIRDTDVFPAFRRNAFDEGVLAGVRALAAAAREE
ncbi:MAG: TPM domain-containing protein, partial [Deltaproteobacteria bacterium]